MARPIAGMAGAISGTARAVAATPGAIDTTPGAIAAAPGAVSGMASAIAEEDCNIQSVHMDNEQGAYTALNFILQVRDRMQLARVMRAVRRVQEVVRIGRIKGDDRAS